MNVKSIAFLLVLIIGLCSIAGCAKAKEKGSDGKNVPEDSEYLDHLPENDFDGTTVVIAAFSDVTKASISADDHDGDSVNNALFDSCSAVKTRFNLDINIIESSPRLSNTIKTQLSAGSSDYDILAGYEYYDVGMCLDGLLLDLNKLDKEADVIDISQNYWVKNVIDAINYGDKLYWVAGDISTRTLGCMYCTYVNLDMYEKYMFKKYGSIYDIVRDGKFTFDLLSQMCSEIYVDQDGIEGVSAGDVLGFASTWVALVDGMLAAADYRFVNRYEDGTLELMVSDKDNLARGGRVLEFKENPTIYTIKHNSSRLYTEENMEQFTAGTTLFDITYLYASQYAREMKDDYGILPCPKSSDAQANYRTLIVDTVPIFGISAYSEHVAASAYVLEALCAENSRTVKKVYYDEALKFKYTRDEESAEMIDLIRDSMIMDFGISWSSELSDMSHTYRTMPYNAMANTIAKREGMWNTKLNDLIEKLKETK